jgi:hypothetical protein
MRNVNGADMPTPGGIRYYAMLLDQRFAAVLLLSIAGRGRRVWRRLSIIARASSLGVSGARDWEEVYRRPRSAQQNSSDNIAAPEKR